MEPVGARIAIRLSGISGFGVRSRNVNSMVSNFDSSLFRFRVSRSLGCGNREEEVFYSYSVRLSTLISDHSRAARTRTSIVASTAVSHSGVTLSAVRSCVQVSNATALRCIRRGSGLG